jgi:plastocyanin
MVPMALLLTLGSVSLASAHPASHLATDAVAKKRPTITIMSFAFTVPAKVRAGATIKVVNKDSFAHTVTADGGAFDIAVPGSTTVKFKAPATKGKYAFHCSIHPSMQATLVVRAP